jgi:F0F1-type ATP synthase assembly protein I
MENNLARAMVLGLELGFAIASPLIVFLLIGVWLDHKIGTMPLFVIIFLLVGLIAVVLEVRYLIVPFLEKRSQNKNSKK